MGESLGAGKGREAKREGDRGGRKGKVGWKGEPGEGKERRERGMEGISLPHGHVKTLAALHRKVFCQNKL